MAFTVLFVCTGNICRSPTAEALMRARLQPAAPVSVASAGTRALVGHGVDTPTAIALRELGGDCGEHVARALTPELVARADLVLTAASTHRAEVVAQNPLVFRRTFTIREFGRLGAALGPLGGTLGADPAEVTERALRARVAEVAAQRGWLPAPEPGGDDIGDPFGAPLSIARVCAATVADAVDAAIRALGLA